MTWNPQSFNFAQKEKIIFFITALFSIQLLILISLYGENWSIELAGPNGGAGLPVMHSYFITGEYFYDVLFQEQDSHIHVSSRIPLLLSLFFNDFDTKNLMFVGWAMLSASVYFLYKILKRENEKLIWLLIPISALIFNPIQYFTVLWSFAFFCYGIPFLATVIITYLLNKKKYNKKSYFVSLAVGVIASFSIVGGPLALVSGVFPLAYNKEMKKLCCWIFVIALVAIAYITAWSGKISERFLINPETQFFNFLKSIALPFTVKFDIFYGILGISLIILFIISFVILIKKQHTRTTLPWIQMAFVGFFISIMIALGKGNVSYYYSTMTDLFSIGLIGLIGGILVLQVKSNIKKNQIMKIIFIIVIISMLILLIPSYYMGWKLADDFNLYETKRNSCYTLNPDNNECELNYTNLTDAGSIERLQVMNELLRLNKGIFVDKSLNIIALNDQKIFNEELVKIKHSESGYGKIIEVNGSNAEKIQISDEPLITISGWILDEKQKTIDYLYILSNDKPLTKISDFRNITNYSNHSFNNLNNNSFWEISFLSGYLEKKCNEISIIGFKNNMKILIDDKVIICKS